jgi:hypothetical protein
MTFTDDGEQAVGVLLHAAALRELIGILRDEGVLVYKSPTIELHLLPGSVGRIAERVSQTPEDMEKEAKRRAAEYDSVLFGD